MKCDASGMTSCAIFVDDFGRKWTFQMAGLSKYIKALGDELTWSDISTATEGERAQFRRLLAGWLDVMKDEERGANQTAYVERPEGARKT
jgi:hypothetical protein